MDIFKFSGFDSSLSMLFFYFFIFWRGDVQKSGKYATPSHNRTTRNRPRSSGARPWKFSQMDMDYSQDILDIIKGCATCICDTDDVDMVHDVGAFIGSIITEDCKSRGKYITTKYELLNVPELLGAVKSTHCLTEFYRAILTTEMSRAPRVPSREMIDYISEFNCARAFLNVVCEIMRSSSSKPPRNTTAAAAGSTADGFPPAAKRQRIAPRLLDDVSIVCRDKLLPKYNALSKEEKIDLDVVHFCMLNRCGEKKCQFCRRLRNGKEKYYALHESTKCYINYTNGAEIMVTGAPNSQRTFNHMVIHFTENKLSVKTNITKLGTTDEGWNAKKGDREVRLTNYFARRFFWSQQLATIYKDLVETNEMVLRDELDIDYKHYSWLTKINAEFGTAEDVARTLQEATSLVEIPAHMQRIQHAHVILCALCEDEVNFNKYFEDNSKMRIRDIFLDTQVVDCPPWSPKMMQRVSSYESPKNQKEIHCNTYLARVVREVAMTRNRLALQ